MKYMLLAYGNEEKFNQMSKDELAEIGEKCKSFDAAVELASLHPAARMGEELGWGIELRPMDYCPAIREAEAACIS